MIGNLTRVRVGACPTHVLTPAATASHHPYAFPLAPKRPSLSPNLVAVIPNGTTPPRSALKLHAAGQSAGGENNFTGFGKEVSPNIRREFVEDAAPAEVEEEEEEIEMRPEYQVYADPLYKPQRTVGPVDVAFIDDKTGRGLVTTADTLPGDLLVISAALGVAPDSEDLCAFMLKTKLSAAQKSVLAQLFDGTAESMKAESSITTLDPRYWAARQRAGGDSVPDVEIDETKLLNIIQKCACSDVQQDAACMQTRQQKGSGFIGVWPEFAMINHSCMPNSSITVIKDRALIHSADEIPKGGQVTRNYLGQMIPKGGQITRNYLGQMVTGPQPVRAAALKQLGYDFTCDCARCRLENRVSADMQGSLMEAYHWYVNDALPAWNEAQVDEDIDGLRSVLEEAHLMIGEVEAMIQKEAGISDQEQMMLRASVYDCYDLLVMCDEVVNQ
eukprot:gene12587-15811_t